MRARERRRPSMRRRRSRSSGVAAAYLAVEEAAASACCSSMDLLSQPRATSHYKSTELRVPSTELNAARFRRKTKRRGRGERRGYEEVFVTALAQCRRRNLC